MAGAIPDPADVAELADALDLGSSEETHVGSSPTVRTSLRPASAGRAFFGTGSIPVASVGYLGHTGGFECAGSR